MIRLSGLLVVLLVYQFVYNKTIAADSIPTPLHIIHHPDSFQQSVQTNPLKEMVVLKNYIPGIQIEFPYGSSNNFTGRQIYVDQPEAYLRINAAKSLQKAQAFLKTKGIGIKVWDAYRPYAITEKLWEVVRDEKYTANPAKGSAHNRGIAVDLTLVDLTTGVELDMGTGFDHFSDTAHHGFTSLTPAILKNRKLLRSVMEANGFRALESEWWHYTFISDISYEILNLSFAELSKLQKRNLSN